MVRDVALFIISHETESAIIYIVLVAFEASTFTSFN